MKKCPYCAEQIQDQAIVCRFCNRELVSTSNQNESLDAKNTSKSTPIILILIGAAFILGAWFLFKDNDNDNNSQRTTIRTPVASTYSVVYEISGTSSAGSMTWSTDQGGTEQGDYKIPFSKSYIMDYGNFAYISVQNKNETGSVTCRILINGHEWRKSTSTGAYVIATCDGLVGGE